MTAYGQSADFRVIVARAPAVGTKAVGHGRRLNIRYVTQQTSLELSDRRRSRCKAAVQLGRSNAVESKYAPGGRDPITVSIVYACHEIPRLFKAWTSTLQGIVKLAGLSAIGRAHDRSTLIS